MLWSVGRYDLRLTDEEFWGLVPRQFVALMKRRKEAIQRQEYTSAMVCQAIFNVRGIKVKATQFMPSWKEAKRPESSWQEDRAKFMAAAAPFGGA